MAHVLDSQGSLLLPSQPCSETEVVWEELEAPGRTHTRPYGPSDRAPKRALKEAWMKRTAEF